MVDNKEELSGTNYIVEGLAEKLLEQSKDSFKQLKLLMKKKDGLVL